MMPSKTPKQKKFMAAVANNPKFAKKAGVAQSVGKEFAAADFAKGKATTKPEKQSINKPKTNHGKGKFF
jgi:hypothetical protein